MRNPYATDEGAMHKVTRADLEAMRPRSTSFLDLKSLRNGDLVDYRPPMIDMTGRLKDTSNPARD